MAKADNAIDEAHNVGSEFRNPANNSSIVGVDTGFGPPNVVLTYDDGPEPASILQLWQR